MTLYIFIECTRDDCTTLQPTHAQTVLDARFEVRAKGWGSRQVYREGGMTTEDYCPVHIPVSHSNRPADITTRVPRAQCYTTDPRTQAMCLAYQDGIADEVRALADWTGHDQLGHRMVNLLVRDGIRTVAELLAAKPEELLDLRGFGKAAMTRWEHFKEMDRAA